MDMNALVALHRYYIWTNRLREWFDRSLAVCGWPKASDFPTWFADDPGLFMSHWYASLYVVVEGYQELGLHDTKVDSLLASSNVHLLKRYRNGVDHFQKTYFDLRFVDFMGTADTPQWTRDLNRELGRFFIETLRKESGSSAAAS
jgi:hypothetical protein